MTAYEKADRYREAIGEVRPFEGRMLEQLRDYYRIGLTWSSNAIEGNTLTISETKVVLEDGLTIGGRPLRDFYETIGHGRAYDFMFSLIREKTIGVDEIKAMHRLFYRDIDEANAGSWRREQVVVSGSDYVFPQPQEIEEQMRGLAQWMADGRQGCHPIEFAALLHLKFVSIHPFLDGNGRTARLLMNLALLQDGYQLAIIPPVCRAQYIEAIRQYQGKGRMKPFCGFVAERVVETQKEMMRLLHIAIPKE